MTEIKKPGTNAEKAVENALRIARSEERPVRILFVCLGNICRSPAAEGMMQHICNDMSPAQRPELDSAGFYGGHAGELPDRRMRMVASRRGLVLTHRSRKIHESDFDYFDLLLGMDDSNISDLHDLAPTPEAECKIARMSDFAVNYQYADCVPDPYYDGLDGFENVLNLLEDATTTLRKLIISE